MAEVNNTVQQIKDAIPDLAQNATVGLSVMHQEKLMQLGTGTLLKIADSGFLITAKHVLRDAKSIAGSLAITGSNGKFVQGAGNWRGTESDSLDIGVLKLDEQVMEQLSEKTFLRLYDVGTECVLTNSLFAMFGYPGEWSSPAVANGAAMELGALIQVMSDYRGSARTLAGFEPGHHLLLHINKAELYSEFNSSGGFPKRLGGISGCGIWKIGDLRENTDSWNSQRSRIVAVQTGVYGQDRSEIIVKSTKFEHVLGFLRGIFPETRRPIDLIRAESPNIASI